MINLYANNQIVESVPEPRDFKKLDLPLNCPNCGAPIHGRSCEYCGTTFYRLAVGEDSYEQELRRLKQEEAYLKTQYAQAVQTSAILSNLQTHNLVADGECGALTWRELFTALVPSYESIRQSCQADQDALNRMQNQNLAASTNVYPYVIQEPIMTKETWVERFKNIFRR